MSPVTAPALSENQMQNQKQNDMDVVLQILNTDVLATGGVSERQMLVQGLPHALTGVGDISSQQHEYQRRFISLARDYLVTLEDGAKNATVAAKNSIEQAKEACLVAAQEVQDAEGAVEKARCEAADRARVLHEADEAVRNAEQEEKEAQKSKAEVTDGLTLIRNEHDKATSIYEGAFLMLREGGWGDDEMKTESCDAVNEHLESRGSLEAALLAAAPVALQTHPQGRTPFDNSAIDAVGAVFKNDAEIATAKLAEGAPAERQANAEALGFWALADILRERAQAAAAERSAADKAVRDADEKQASLKQRAAELECAQETCAAECTTREHRQNDVSAALEALDRLVANNYTIAVADDATMAQPETSAMDVDMETGNTPVGKVELNVAMEVDMGQLGA